MVFSSNIRVAYQSDASGIAVVHADSWRETYFGILPDAVLNKFSYSYRLPMWNANLKDTPPWVYIYEFNREIVGFVSARPVNNQLCELNNLYVLQTFHGKGVGRRLFQTILKRITQEGFEKMVLWVLKDSPAVCFYEAMGGEFIADDTIEMAGHPIVVSKYFYGKTC
jgi:ribosomal protein S18 acetylase RimI-like enzyme